jgi:hypothetical protein
LNFPVFAKRSNFFLVKGLIMLKVQSRKNLPKTLPSFIEKKLFKIFTIEMDFEKVCTKFV